MSVPIYSPLAPIVLFAYKRPNELRQVLEALKKNYLATESDLFVFVDGPKNEDDKPNVETVRNLIDDLTGFRSITRYYSKTNKGLAASVISGVTQVIEQYGRVIVLEDDLITSPNFLNFMNDALILYKKEKKIFSITGYTFPFKKPDNYQYDVYFFPRTGSWGWATWNDRWQRADWNVNGYTKLKKDSNKIDEFEQGGTDLFRMLRRQQEGKIDSWLIRWCYSQYLANGVTVYPTISKTQNIGFNKEATHTNNFNRYVTVLDKSDNVCFKMPEKPVISLYYKNKVLQKFSIQVRIYGRVRTLLCHVINLIHNYF